MKSRINPHKPEGKDVLYEAEKRRLKVAAVGDITITDSISAREENGFLALKKIIDEADVACGHVEGVITGDEGYPAHDSADYVKLPPSAAEEVKSLGIDMVSLAGNHSMDYADGGLLATIRNLDRAGVAHAGTGRNLAEARAPAFFTSPKGKIALISVCSYFSPWARAGEQRRDCVGRAGINPLRYETRYIVDERALKELKRISKMLGFEDDKARKAGFGMFWKKVPDTGTQFHFMPRDFIDTTYNKFVVGDKPGIDTVASEPDVRAIIRSITDARAQADWVFLALHSHEADRERTNPPKFFKPFALRCIDAGADAIIGTGPHILRGIEIYKNRPIFYSLGNCVMQFESVRTYPADFYERYEMPSDYTAGEAWTELTKNDACGFALDRDFWQSAFALFSFEDGRLDRIKLYPLTLGFGKRRGQRGLPLIAEGAEGKEIIEKMQKLSSPYGTKIEYKDGIGVVNL